MTEENIPQVNALDYKMEMENLEKQVKRCKEESNRKHRVIRRLENRIDELEKTLHHQGVLLYAYKDVLFHYQAKIGEYEKRYGDL